MMRQPGGEHSREYLGALKSYHWKCLRNEWLFQTSSTCSRCGTRFPESKLELHHLTYVRLGCERPEDTVLLCKRCHDIEDEIR